MATNVGNSRLSFRRIRKEPSRHLRSRQRAWTMQSMKSGTCAEAIAASTRSSTESNGPTSSCARNVGRAIRPVSDAHATRSSAKPRRTNSFDSIQRNARRGIDRPHLRAKGRRATRAPSPPTVQPVPSGLVPTASRRRRFQLRHLLRAAYRRRPPLRLMLMPLYVRNQLKEAFQRACRSTDQRHIRWPAEFGTNAFHCAELPPKS